MSPRIQGPLASTPALEANETHLPSQPILDLQGDWQLGREVREARREQNRASGDSMGASGPLTKEV